LVPFSSWRPHQDESLGSAGEITGPRPGCFFFRGASFSRLGFLRGGLSFDQGPWASVMLAFPPPPFSGVVRLVGGGAAPSLLFGRIFRPRRREFPCFCPGFVSLSLIALSSRCSIEFGVPVMLTAETASRRFPFLSFTPRYPSPVSSAFCRLSSVPIFLRFQGAHFFEALVAAVVLSVAIFFLSVVLFSCERQRPSRDFHLFP